jgi:hypothetical protein
VVIDDLARTPFCGVVGANCIRFASNRFAYNPLLDKLITVASSTPIMGFRYLCDHHVNRRSNVQDMDSFLTIAHHKEGFDLLSLLKRR